MTELPTVASGVQELIDRLRDEGVQAGEQEAQRLIDEAHHQAAEIITDAKAQAEQFQSEAHTDIERERKAAQESLQVAVRDTVLELKSQITAHFAARVKRLASAELHDRDFLRELILAVAGRARPDEAEEHPMQVLVSQELFGDTSRQKGGSRAVRRQLIENILAISAEMLRDGVELKPAGDARPGIRVRFSGEDVEIDLTDEAISEALLKHLLPRFRSTLEGVEEG